MAKNYQGFNVVESKIEKQGKSPESAKRIAASIGKKKYGEKAMKEHAAKGTSMKNTPAKEHPLDKHLGKPFKARA